jgi:hypothetical protein
MIMLHRRPVKGGYSTGLKAGDRVVVKPPKELKDGSRIKVAEQ